mmetsp:Transcript_14408/g.50643  ORF Transcript_14408/g.50643 Transcript_14408/m.50643 type:complete len:213 (+) Transcript_14408:679-1317(+)
MIAKGWSGWPLRAFSRGGWLQLRKGLAEFHGGSMNFRGCLESHACGIGPGAATTIGRKYDNCSSLGLTCRHRGMVQASDPDSDCLLIRHRTRSCCQRLGRRTWFRDRVAPLRARGVAVALAPLHLRNFPSQRSARQAATAIGQRGGRNLWEDAGAVVCRNRANFRCKIQVQRRRQQVVGPESEQETAREVPGERLIAECCHGCRRAPDAHPQ